jgi:hypothetical protein
MPARKAAISSFSPAMMTRSRPFPEAMRRCKASRCQDSRKSRDSAPRATEKTTTARLSTDHLKNTTQKATATPMMTSPSTSCHTDLPTVL